MGTLQKNVTAELRRGTGSTGLASGDAATAGAGAAAEMDKGLAGSKRGAIENGADIGETGRAKAGAWESGEHRS